MCLFNLQLKVLAFLFEIFELLYKYIQGIFRIIFLIFLYTKNHHGVNIYGVHLVGYLDSP